MIRNLTAWRVWARSVGVFAVATVTVLLLVGCGSSGASDAKVASIIENQLPGSIHRTTGVTAAVDDVTCVSQQNNTFDCIAKVSEATESGIQTVVLDVGATCDSQACTWHVNP